MKMKSLFLLALGTIVLANTEFDMNTIDIEGTYNPNSKVSQADRLRDYRRKLEEQNEQMLKKKIETLRLQQEMELMKKVQNAFNQTMTNLNNIQ